MNEGWLLLAGLFAGFIDSILGGGGVITLPALLGTGMPPHAAIATNKVVGTGASSIATLNYTRAGLTSRLAWKLWPLSAGVAALGAWAVLGVEARFVQWLALGVVGALAVYVLFAPDFAKVRRARHVAWLIGGAVVIALYDGALGPGTGNLLLALWVFAGGLPMLQAAASGRVLNFASNVGALAFWATTGLIDWCLGLFMAIGTAAGGWLGSRSNIKTEAKWVRPLFVVVAVALLVRAVWTA